LENGKPYAMKKSSKYSSSTSSASREKRAKTRNHKQVARERKIRHSKHDL
jgi:hypothetical protein